MLIKNKKSSNKKLLILVLVVLLLIILKQKMAYLGSFLDKFVYPVQSKIYLLEDNAHRFYNNLKSYPELIKQIEGLRRENTLLSIENMRYKPLREENERLKKLLEMKDEQPNIKIGTVGFRSVNDITENFYINLGMKDGISEHAYAVYENNLVGRVVEVNADHSKVRMITSNKLRISSITENNILGVIGGTEEENGNLIFTSTLIKEDEIQIGDEIFTSGISDIYSKGIKIGTIIEKGEEPGEYTVKPGIDLIELKEVVLIERE